MRIKKNPFCFPLTHRLVTKAEYQQIFDCAKKISQKHVVILFKQHTYNDAKLGVIVGKRIAPHAVTRNKIKRVIRESFRINQDKLKKFSIIVIARQPCNTISKAELRKGLDISWEKLIKHY